MMGGGGKEGTAVCPFARVLGGREDGAEAVAVGCTLFRSCHTHTPPKQPTAAAACHGVPAVLPSQNTLACCWPHPLPYLPPPFPRWQGRARRGATLHESVLLHAVARLALHPHITNIQASRGSGRGGGGVVGGGAMAQSRRHATRGGGRAGRALTRVQRNAMHTVCACVGGVVDAASTSRFYTLLSMQAHVGRHCVVGFATHGCGEMVTTGHWQASTRAARGNLPAAVSVESQPQTTQPPRALRHPPAHDPRNPATPQPPHPRPCQASWVKMGPERAARLLSAGCNDMGGSIMNESITRAAGRQEGEVLAAIISSAMYMPPLLALLACLWMVCAATSWNEPITRAAGRQQERALLAAAVFGRQHQAAPYVPICLLGMVRPVAPTPQTAHTHARTK